MKILKIYSNKNFHNIEFNEGFNVVIAKIFDKNEMKKDTHNLGKTYIAYLIDYLLLKTKKKPEFSDKIFQGQVFYGEFKLSKNKFIVVKRGIDNNSKISYKINDKPLNGFELKIKWDKNLPLQKAKEKFNDLFKFDVIKKFNYRKILGFFIRTQEDFSNVFRIKKFSRSKDIDFKPIIFELLGYDSEKLLKKYELNEEIKNLKIEKRSIEPNDSKIKIENVIDLLQKKYDERSAEIDKFNFYDKDKEETTKLVEKIDIKLKMLNAQRYNSTSELERLKKSLELSAPSEFDIKQVRTLFEEAKIYFSDNIEKDYKRLLDFNKQIISERREYLSQSYKKLKKEIQELNSEILHLENEKSEILSYLIEKDSYQKFKKYQKDLIILNERILKHKNELEKIDEAGKLEKEINSKTNYIKELSRELNKQIEEKQEQNVKNKFNDFILKVLNKDAMVFVDLNKYNNPEFNAIFYEDNSNTSEGQGYTYKKMLCIAFDIAVLAAYHNKSFFKFVYHDGALDGLDDRKKLNFIKTVKEYVRNYDIQYIFSVIDSEIPLDETGKKYEFSDKEICLELDDKSEKGKLFKQKF